MIDRTPGWEGSARVLAAGGGVGMTRAGGGSRPYALASVSFGLDPREGDHITAMGATLAPGATIEDAQRDADRVAERRAREHPSMPHPV